MDAVTSKVEASHDTAWVHRLLGGCLGHLRWLPGPAWGESVRRSWGARALIGPNGAGKTTLLDVICGQVKPDTGRVIFGDTTDLSVLESYQIAALGIGRKFQTPSVFKHLTLLENLMLSLLPNAGTSGRRCLARRPRRNWIRWRRFWRVSAYLRRRIGRQDRCPMARYNGWRSAWDGADPALFLLDEPVAGMTGREREKPPSSCSAWRKITPCWSSSMTWNLCGRPPTK